MARHKRKSKKHSVRSKSKALSKGIFHTNPRGYGFIETADAQYFVPESKTRDAMDGDVVEFVVHLKHDKKKSGRKKNNPAESAKSSQNRHIKNDEARIIRVVERNITELVGTYNIAEPFGIVVPDDPRIKHDVFTRLSDSPTIKDGTFVRVSILEYPTRKSAAFGRIVEVYDERTENDIIAARIVSKYQLATKFSDDALMEASNAKLDVSGAINSGYRDIRDRFVFTIDPADAKDFDDALSLELVDAGKWRLGVHIADVSAYVKWASAIDMDARARATSTYLADRVLPMLPPELCENLCSLRPGEDRLCMTVDLLLDDSAHLIDYDIYPAIMHSTMRLTYDEAQSILDSPSDSPISSKLMKCSQIAKARARYRLSKGGIEFQTKEAKVELDSDGSPIGILVREKTDATGLIEEAMIFANEVVATYLSEHEFPCAYRVHEAPDADKLDGLVEILQEFKWFTSDMAHNLPTGNPHVIQRILDAAKGRAEYEMVTLLFLRSQMRAVYSPEDEGHYGLGLKHYCHFTSPIRRYPDLIVHRMLKAALGFRQNDFKMQVKKLKGLCAHSSEMERNAEYASFDSQKIMIAQYMKQFIGQEFDAIICAVANYGFYVRLENCAEGLVPAHTLGDEYFIYSERKHRLKGKHTNTKYQLGMRVRVKLAEADTSLGRLDFALVE